MRIKEFVTCTKFLKSPLLVRVSLFLSDVPTEGSKEFKGSGSIDNEWNSDYANSSTPAYKRLYNDLKDHLTAVLKKSYEDNFIGVDVANFQKGSIKFDFTVYLKATTIVNEETLKDVIQKGEGGSNFTITGVSVKQIAGPKPTTSTTEKPEAESGLEKWKIVLIATIPVIFILLIALLVVVVSLKSKPALVIKPHDTDSSY